MLISNLEKIKQLCNELNDEMISASNEIKAKEKTCGNISASDMFDVCSDRVTEMADALVSEMTISSDK